MISKIISGIFVAAFVGSILAMVISSYRKERGRFKYFFIPISIALFFLSLWDISAVAIIGAIVVFALFVFIMVKVLLEQIKQLDNVSGKITNYSGVYFHVVIGMLYQLKFTYWLFATGGLVYFAWLKD